MSTGVLADADVVLRTGFVTNCSLIAASAIYAYDRCLTLWQEVDLIWSRRSMSVATGLYLLLHVSVAMFLCFEVTGVTTLSCERHYIVYVGRVCGAMLFHLINGAFTALRAFAISGRSVTLASAILLWSLPVVATEVYELVLSVPVDVQWPIGCVISFTGNQKLESPLFIAGQATAIVPEVLMIAAIWHHAFRVKTADGVRQARFNPPFTTILIRDGSVYFVASFVIIVLNVASSAITAINTGILAPIVYSLQVILLSHFYLNLHEANAHQLGIPSNASQMSDLWFTRLLGTLAGSLAYDVPGHSKVEAEDDAAVDVDLQIARILDTDSDSFLTVVASGSGHHSSGSFALSPHSEVALV